ncbi:MAG: cytochrome c peroxidase [Hyphomicrobiaceae bacterium]
MLQTAGTLIAATHLAAILVYDLTRSVAASEATANRPALTKIERLGKSLFEDTELSLNRNQSCALCHAPEAGFTSPREDFNAAGGVVEGSIPGRFGNSKPPSAAYTTQAPVLYHTYEDGELLYVGGHFWNGRATGKKLGNPAADQAQGPFLNPVEMALPSAACVVQRVCKPRVTSHYPVTLPDVWGASICNIAFPRDLDAQCAKTDAKIELETTLAKKIETAFDKIALSIAAYEASIEVNAFSSKYDLVLAGKATLTAEEQKGLELFEGKGLCSKCHVLDRDPRDAPPLFTDFTYDNLGVPRNPENPFYKATEVNPDGWKWLERGLAAYLETDPLYKATAASQLGKVRVPTVRNVDMRPSPGFTKAFMHNGYFKTLKGVVHFYNTRDTKPRCQSPLVTEAQAMKQGCWPEPEVPENVNTEELGNLKLTDTEENAIVAFMKTLTDGHVPASSQRPTKARTAR